MSKQNNWTPEPWADAADLPSDAQARNPMIYFGVVVMGQSNYRRAKTCVNACKGMSDPDKEIKAMRDVWKVAHDFVRGSEMSVAKLDAALSRFAALKAATDASGALSRAGGK